MPGATLAPTSSETIAIMNSRTSPPGSSGTNIHGAQNPLWASAAMRKLEHDIACAIQFDASVMISGKSGTGKKFVAQLIHQRSARGQAPFIIANCQDIMESVLHDRLGSGSADQFKHGLLKTADNGTLLIEEIDKIPVPMQPQLLQFLESGMKNGSDVRLITATTADLLKRVRSNQFRDDLFYRLNVIHLIIPALRDRPEDIPILFRHYLSFYARAEVPRLSTAAWDRLVAYPWPGNVQELKAVTEKVAAQDLSRLVEPDDLPSHIGR
jgi:two-component system response regulator AtoC